MIIIGLLIEQGNTRKERWTSHREGQERIPTHKAGERIKHPQISWITRNSDVPLEGVCVLEWGVATFKLGSRLK